MRYFSTFTGIGGFELGILNAYVEITNRKKNGKSKGNTKENDAVRQRLESAQGKRATDKIGRHGELSDRMHDAGTPTCVGYSEIDRYAEQIYQKHFPNHKNYGDITKIDPRVLPAFDLLVGGFPCQAFSIAGKRGGFDDTRGTLFFEVARIIKQKRPRLLLLENVKGLLSHDDGKTFFTIIATLDELGYDVQWQVLNSKNFGVPQNRERVYIVGHLRGTARPEVFPILGQSETVDKTIFVDESNYRREGKVREYKGTSPTINTAGGGGHIPLIIKIPEATKKGYAEARVGQSINLAVPNSKTRRGRVSDIAQTLDTGMQQHTLTNDMQIRRLTPTECERLQAYPDGWTEGVSDAQRYKTLGNGVTTNVVKAIMERILE